MKGDEDACLRAGCSGYLPKPIDHALLLTTLARFLSAPTPSQISYAARSAGGSTRPAKQSAGDRPLISKLPTDDADFREIVVQFGERLDEQLSAMRVAAADRDFHELAALAHWLKGTSGSAGFPDFYAPADALETLARQQQSDRIDGTLATIEALAARIVIR